MSHWQFVAVAPLSLPWEKAVLLRRRARQRWHDVHFDPSLAATRTGEGTTFVDDAAFRAYGSSTDFALANARLLRRDAAYWIRVDAVDARPFEEFCAARGVAGSLSAHVVIGRNGCLCLVTAFDFPAIEAGSGSAPT
jgi:hypothetical protein